MDKKLKSTIRKWSILLLLMAYVIVAASWAMSKARERRCIGIQVDIEKNSPFTSALSGESVKAELGKLGAAPGRYTLSSINTDSLEKVLSRVNNFERVQCFINSAGKLEISVTPMIPVARIFTPKGESYYINREGKHIDALCQFYADVPVVYGNFTARRPATLVLPVVNRVASDSVLKSLVTMIDFNSPRNICIIPRIRGHVVNLGDTTRLDEKFSNLLLFYRKVMPYCGWETYDTISVKYRGQVVATRRDKTPRRHAPELEEQEDVEEQALQLGDITSTGEVETEPVQETP